MNLLALLDIDTGGGGIVVPRERRVLGNFSSQVSFVNWFLHQLPVGMLLHHVCNLRSDTILIVELVRSDTLPGVETGFFVSNIEYVSIRLISIFKFGRRLTLLDSITQSSNRVNVICIWYSRKHLSASI